MRAILRAVAIAAVATGGLAVIAGGRRLALATVADHRYTAFQYLLFIVLTIGGLVGCVGGILLLMRFRPLGRWAAVLYFVLMAAYCVLAEVSGYSIAGLALATSAIGCLLAPAAGALCKTAS